MKFPALLLYFCASAIILFANIGPGSATIAFQNDKMNHFASFLFLAALAKFSFPRAEVRFVLLGLLIFNASIEVTQGILDNGREPDVLDWVAGTCATLLAFALISLIGKRASA